MITPEQLFIKELEAYLILDMEFTENIRRKISKLLEEYKSSFEVETKIVNHNFFVYRNQANISHVTPKTEKIILEYKSLEEEFNRFCEERNIMFTATKKKGRSTKEITKIRAEFCNYAAENFLVSKSELANFFKLNHATIHYYFNPKYKKK